MKKFTEAELEKSIIELFEQVKTPHVFGEDLDFRKTDQVLLPDDLRDFLRKKYQAEEITDSEIDFILRELQTFPASDLYESNKKFIRLVTEGFPIRREDRTKQDLFVELIDFENAENNIFKFINQLEIQTGSVPRIPDGILYINGLPMVVLEFKSAIREEEATLLDAYNQITVRYRRDIPELFVYNAFCVITDGVNSKMGSLFADYEFYYGWRKVTGDEENEAEGIPALIAMMNGLFEHNRLCDVIHNFIFFPDTNKHELKIVCRYPQYYAANKLYRNILKARRPEGDGRGGTYFGSTGCGKSYAMLFLSRILMRSKELDNPTIILITDRTDLDDQLSNLFLNATDYIGDENILRFDSRKSLRENLNNRESGGVFLTTIHKFTEEAGLLSDRNNIICISDEAHRSQINLDQKITVDEDGAKVHYGFAKFLHDSLPNATYVGVTGTPIDATLDVFGDIIDKYTMREAVEDEITVPIVYEGRAAKVILDSEKLKDIERYYDEAEEAGASKYQIEESKRAVSSMTTILSDPGVIHQLALDFVAHYEGRIDERSTVAEKVMFVCATRGIAYNLYKELIAIRPDWAVAKEAEDFENLKESEKEELFPIERVKLVLTRNKDDEPELWELAGDEAYRKKLDKQFKSDKSNFKIAIIVDMWTTGFDVPALDTMYIYKPLKRHTLIQTISRVNRKYKNKQKGLVVDYIGIKRNMNKALAHYGGLASERDIESIRESIAATKDQLDILDKMFYKFDSSDYYSSSALKRLECLNSAAEFAMQTEVFEHRFMEHCKRLKKAYDICTGDQEAFTQAERDRIHFYLAVRSIVYKITRGEAPDTAQMNRQVTLMVQDALHSSGVEEIFKIGEDKKEINLFDPVYLEKILKIKLPNTRIQVLQQLLAKAISDFKKVNKVRGVDFSKRLEKLVEDYNNRKEQDILVSEVINEFTDKLVDLVMDLDEERRSYKDLGIDFEEKAFYDILKEITIKYEFEYPDDRLIELAKKVKTEVDSISKYTAWDQRDDIKAELKANLIVLLTENDYPPVAHDEVYKEIFEQAENFKKYRGED